VLRKAVAAAVDLLYPLRCAGCVRFDMVLCPRCAAALPRTDTPGHCQFCRAEWDGDGNCPRCVHMHELEGVRASFEMSGTARKLVHALKYGRYRAVAPTMGALMANLPEGLGIDTFFAVPLHKSRTKERGFNQSELLLRHAGWGPVGAGLVRTRSTHQQVGQGFGERRANLAGAFEYRGPRLDGQVVALVDDVVTTGTTMVESARVLRDAGARSVWALAFARASYRPESEEPIDD
jgi:ComF family protein